MIIIEGSARIPEDMWPTARVAMEKMILASRAEEGCLEYAYAVDLLDPDTLRVIERWKDRQALRDHFAMPHMAEFRAALDEVKPTEMSITLYEAEPEPLP